MTLLIVGLIVFFGIHAVPWSASGRERLVQTFGLNFYRALFGVASLAALGLIVMGYADAEKTFLWTAPSFARPLAHTIVPMAFVLMAAGFTGANLNRWTAHPIPSAIGLWAAVHLLNNGDVPSVLLFGGFLTYAILLACSQSRRGVAKRLIGRQPIWRDIAAIAIGLAASILMFRYHATLIGVDIM